MGWEHRTTETAIGPHLRNRRSGQEITGWTILELLEERFSSSMSSSFRPFTSLPPQSGPVTNTTFQFFGNPLTFGTYIPLSLMETQTLSEYDDEAIGLVRNSNETTAQPEAAPKEGTSDGTVTRNKARLVVQGYSQEEGRDYDETFAPVTRLEAIRLLIAFATYMEFTLYQMDVKSVFLNVYLKEEVLVKKPYGFERKKCAYHVYKLDKELYGFKQAPRACVVLCAIFQENPKESHLIDVKKILRYLKGTTDLYLWFPKGSNFNLVGYDDADYVGFLVIERSLQVLAFVKRRWDWGVFGLRVRERAYAFSKRLDGCVMRSRLGFAFAEEELAQWSFVHRVRVVPVAFAKNKNSAYEFIWDDFRFSVLDYEASEILLKAGSTKTIEMPATELCQVGSTFIWDVTIVRGEVIYKEEFVLEEENSYTIILQKEKKLSSPIRNTFKNNEAGKVVLTIKNTSSKK
uniref:Uncharacterized protein LOC104232692 n=1 Tax=Nicotiana sylvestris TaxID=4096 RepID=A0A1U7XBD9_NICSY|nr:PREDICTED: uncharacterized protein LOC104232692 [Nicotiana sylvestris]